MIAIVERPQSPAIGAQLVEEADFEEVDVIRRVAVLHTVGIVLRPPASATPQLLVVPIRI